MITQDPSGPPQGPGRPAVRLTPEEFRRQARAIQDVNPHAFDALGFAGRADSDATGVSPDSVGQDAPEANDEGIRPLDALGRGMAQGVNEASNTVVGLGGWVVKHMMPDVAPGHEKQYEGYLKQKQEFLDWYDAGRTSDINPLQISENAMQQMFGKKQEGVGGFIETIGTVATGVLATGGLVGGIRSVATRALVQGALIDGAFFDPYQKRIANMIEDAKLPFASELSSLMSAHPGDTEAEARFKAVLEGVMVGKAVGKVFHSIQALRYQRLAKAGKITAEQAEPEIIKNLNLAAKAEDNHTDVLRVITNGDGTATVVPNSTVAVMKQIKELGLEADVRAGAMERGGMTHENVEHSARTVLKDHLDARAVKTMQAEINDGGIPLVDSPVNGNGNGNGAAKAEPKLVPALSTTDPKTMKVSEIGKELDGNSEYRTITNALKERGHNVTERLDEGLKLQARDESLRSELNRRRAAGDPSPDMDRGALATHEARQDELKNGKHFANVAEAQSFAASVNEAGRSLALPVNTVSSETVKLFREKVANLLEGAKTLDDVEELFRQWGTDVNFSRMSSPIEVKAQVEAISHVLPTITTMARAIGTQPHEVTMKLAMAITRNQDAGEALEAVTKMFGDTKDLPQRLLVARGWMVSKAAEVARLSRIADLDPNNAKAMQSLTEALDQLWDFHSSVAGVKSNVARTMDAMKIDAAPVADRISATEAVGDRMAKRATDALDKTPKEIAAEAEATAKEAAEQNGKAPKAEPLPRTASPLQEAARQEAQDALAALKQARADAANARHAQDTPATANGNTPNATDFSLSRARARAQRAIEAARKQGLHAEGPVSPEVAAHGEQRSRDVLDASAEQSANPLEAPASNGKAAKVKNPIDELSKTLDAEEKQLEAIITKEPVQGPREHNDPVGDYIKSHKSPGVRLTSGMTKRQLRGLARQVRLADGDAEEVLSALYAERAGRMAKGDPTLWQKVIGYRMAAMLSGPKTLLINASSNALAAMQKPAEMWWAGVRSNNPALRQQGADIMVGLWRERGDAFKAAKKALLAGEQMLDKSKEAFEDTTHELAAATGNTWLRTAINVPSRVLMSTDEFFKQLNYRANVRSQALRDAREIGLTEAKDIAQHLHDTMESAFALNADPEDMLRYKSATNPVALEYARVNTFTNHLGDGTWGKTMQDAVIKHPMARLVMPFVRTPVNLFRWTWERTPGLARFSQGYKEAIEAGGERAAVAKAGVEMGTAMYGFAASYALAGGITGNGPSNKELRDQWLAAGNQPYSVKIPGTDTWISYRRADPVITPLGLAATAVENLQSAGKQIASEARIRQAMRGDEHPAGELLGMIADYVHASGEITQKDGTEMATAFVAAIAANVSSKTFLQGIVDFADAISGGESWKVQHWVTNIAGSFVPNAIRQLNPDDTLRETRGLWDEIQGRSPWSGNLEPKRNLFGEPVLRAPGGYLNRNINPFTLSHHSKLDPSVADQLVELGRAMPMPAEKKKDGQVDLTSRSQWAEGAAPERQNQSPYDRMLEIMANPGDGKPSLKEALTKLVTRPEWKKITDGTAAQPGGMKYKLAAGIIGVYQDIAYARVKSEYPKLQKELSTEDAEKAAAAMGGEDMVGAVRRIFQPQQ